MSNIYKHLFCLFLSGGKDGGIFDPGVSNALVISKVILIISLDFLISFFNKHLQICV